MALVEVKVPDIGDFKDVAIIEVLVKPGDTVKAEQSLLTVESDKASMEIPSSAAGVVKEMKVALGDKINEGTVILMLETGAAAAPAPAPAPAQPSASPKPAPAEEASDSGTSAAAEIQDPRGIERPLPVASLPAHEPTKPPLNLPHASPSIRRIARELGVPLEEVK